MHALEQRYQPMLQLAHDFLSKQKKPGNGSSLNSAHLNYVIANGGLCLHCSVTLTKKNANTEHIHDKALGGSNKSNNKVLMCKKCNAARNATMQLYLGPPSYWKSFPGNWDRVKRYLIWNAITVDKGHLHGRIFPEIQTIFENLISYNGITIKAPKQWFGRGDCINIIQTKTNNIIIRMFDRIFGFDPKENFRSNGYPISNIEGENNSGKIQVYVNDDLEDNNDFLEPVFAVLSTIDDEVKLTHFSNLFKNYLEEKGEARQSFKQFARSFGVPKSWSCLNVFERFFPDKITIRREGTMVFIKPKISV